ncbi:MAG: FKBP-type peptidyl-prolyl cis-trans isomerase [Chloroflexota bacterium]
MPKERTTATITIAAAIALVIMVVAALTAPPAVPPVTPAPTATAAPPTASAADGQAFLASNASADGVQTTASGLQYKVVTEGTGARPSVTDTVTVNYEGTLIDGTKFDSSYDRNQTATFRLDEVIDGWTEGLQLMTVGSTYMFYIPSELAYGEAGRAPVIPPNSVLVFKIELLDIPSQAGAELTAAPAETTPEAAVATAAPEVTAEATSAS